MEFKNFAGLDFFAQHIQPNESVHMYIGKEFNSHRVALVQQRVLRFIVSEVKMPCTCYPKAKAIQSRVRKQNDCPSFGNKGTSSRIPTDQASFMSIYTVSIEHGLRTTDWV